MNYKMVFNVLGKTFLIIAGLMLVPMFVGIGYGENNYLSFLIPVGILIVAGLPLSLMKVKDKSLFAKEGFVIVSLSWILMSLVGCLPFVISGEIPNFFDAFFETVSGFTTTGATVLSLSNDKIDLSMGIMFWRIFTHFIGGMGVLVFLLAVLPLGGDAMHILRAESPGPSASKFVSKIRHTARILYAIYIILTVLETILLLLGGMNLYESVLTAFSTAGTGGFSFYGDSIAHYNSVYIEMVVSVFMFLFATNFNLFYLIILGQFTKIFKSEEFICYFAMIFLATITIAINLAVSGLNFWQGLRYAFFQTTAISSTTGFSSADFIGWPTLSKCVLLVLMVVGGCGGSTCGGIKVSRTLLLFKTCQNGVKKSLHPRAITNLKLDGEILSKEVERDTSVYFILWVAIVIVSTILLSFDPACDQVLTSFTASITCIGNVGPGLTEIIGPLGNFASFSGFSKILMSVVMLAGRLEILPMIILFAPRTWIKGQ